MGEPEASNSPVRLPPKRHLPLRPQMGEPEVSKSPLRLPPKGHLPSCGDVCLPNSSSWVKRLTPAAQMPTELALFPCTDGEEEFAFGKDSWWPNRDRPAAPAFLGPHRRPKQQQQLQQHMGGTPVRHSVDVVLLANTQQQHPNPNPNNDPQWIYDIEPLGISSVSSSLKRSIAPHQVAVKPKGSARSPHLSLATVNGSLRIPAFGRLLYLETEMSNRTSPRPMIGYLSPTHNGYPSPTHSVSPTPPPPIRVSSRERHRSRPHRLLALHDESSETSVSNDNNNDNDNDNENYDEEDLRYKELDEEFPGSPEGPDEGPVIDEEEEEEEDAVMRQGPRSRSLTGEASSADCIELIPSLI